MTTAEFHKSVARRRVEEMTGTRPFHSIAEKLAPPQHLNSSISKREVDALFSAALDRMNARMEAL